MTTITLDQLRDEAYRVYQTGNLPQAARLAQQLLQHNPRSAEGIYLLGVIANDERRLPEAGERFRQAAEFAPGNHVFANAYGENQLTQGNQDEALRWFLRAAQLQPAYERVHNNLGRLRHMQGELATAQASFEQAVRLNPRYAVALNNLGAILQAQGKLAEALPYFHRALQVQPNYPEALFNLGGVLHAQGDSVAAVARLQEAVRLRPTYARAQALLAQTLVAIGQVAASVVPLRAVVQLQPQDAESYLHLADILMLLGENEEALDVFNAGLRLEPDSPECFAHRFHLKEQLCEWSDRPAELERLWADVLQFAGTEETVPLNPVYAASLPWTETQQLTVARSFAEAYQRAASRVPPGAPVTPRTSNRLKVAYLSRDIYDHPVGHQIQALFGLHNRDEFEIHLYSYGPNDHSVFRQRCERDVEFFHETFGWSTAAVQRQIQADGIQILVDLMGYTGFARTACLALRPAPIQVIWLGYPGTMGAEFFDYLIGDPVVTPTELAGGYSESIVRLPHSFMVTDHAQPIAERRPTRAEAGLPDDAVVFCCFNKSYKIDPGIFDAWMRILSQVPGSVLWMSIGGATARANLRQSAEARGVSPERLIFAGHVPSKADHLARLGLADLFLDTLYYNAHATACDALWAGLPVLTCPSRSYASRVGASLLTAVGLPELIAGDVAQYEQLAVNLACDRGRLGALREKLASQRLTAPLFDTARFARNLENAYRTMWETHAAGLPPHPLDLADVVAPSVM